MKTIFITGASTGIGKETALHFARNGWNVAATMRNPVQASDWPEYKNLKFFRLDVLDAVSIHEAMEGALQAFGSIDVLFNNAGYALVGPFEAMSPEQIRKQFDTNVFGVMEVSRAFLPYFRERRSGTLITTSSVGGRLTFPLYSPYHSTKWAVEGFMESLGYELRPFHIRVKLIEPGPIKTDFYDRSLDTARKEGLTAYDHYVEVASRNMESFSKNAQGPSVVARKVMQAATDESFRLRYPAGYMAPVLIFIRKLLPPFLFKGFVRMQVEKGI